MRELLWAYCIQPQHRSLKSDPWVLPPQSFPALGEILCPGPGPPNMSCPPPGELVTSTWSTSLCSDANSSRSHLSALSVKGPPSLEAMDTQNMQHFYPWVWVALGSLHLKMNSKFLAKHWGWLMVVWIRWAQVNLPARDWHLRATLAFLCLWVIFWLERQKFLILTLYSLIQTVGMWQESKCD